MQRANHWKRPWCWERLKAGEKGGHREWNGWMAWLTQWMWGWTNSGRHWRTREAWSAAVHGVWMNWTEWVGGVFQLFWGRVGISRNWATAHFLSFWWPWNCHGARVYVIDHADVLQQAYTEAQGRLEVNLSTTLNLVGFQSVYVMFLGSVILLKVVPCPLPSCFKISSQTFFSIFSS